MGDMTEPSPEERTLIDKVGREKVGTDARRGLRARIFNPYCFSFRRSRAAPDSLLYSCLRHFSLSEFLSSPEFRAEVRGEALECEQAHRKGRCR